VQQITNKNWYKNYNNNPKRAVAYLSQPGLTARKFTNDMKLLETAGAPYTNLSTYILVNAAPNTIATKFPSTQVQALLKGLRGNRNALSAQNTAAAQAAAEAMATKWRALGLKVGDVNLSQNNLNILKNLANGYARNNPLLAGLNLTKNANKAYALRLLLNGLRSTSSGYAALKTSNIERQYKNLLQTYLNTYTKSGGTWGGGNRSTKYPATYRAVTKNEALKEYKNARTRGNEPVAALHTAILAKYPSPTFNWAPVINAITANNNLKTKNPRILEYLPPRA
jgi:hypothetical protein